MRSGLITLARRLPRRSRASARRRARGRRRACASAAGRAARGQLRTDEVVVAADAARRDDHGLRRELEGADRRRGELASPRPTALGSSTAPRTPVDGASGRRRGSSTRCRKRSVTRPRALRLPHAAHERLERRRGRSPSVRWKRGTELPCPSASPAAALGPADDREEADAPSRAARRASRRPRSRRTPPPSGAASGPRRGRSPRVPSQSCQASSCESRIPIRRCSGAVDEEEAAERPERLAAERLLGLLVDEDHPPAGVRELGRRDEPGEARPDDDRRRPRSRAECSRTDLPTRDATPREPRPAPGGRARCARREPLPFRRARSRASCARARRCRR